MRNFYNNLLKTIVYFVSLIGIGCTHTTDTPVALITIDLESEEQVHEFVEILNNYANKKGYRLSSDNKDFPDGQRIFLFRLKRADGLSLLVISADGMGAISRGMKFQISVYSEIAEQARTVVKEFSGILETKFTNIDVSIEFREKSGRETRFIWFPW